LKNLNKKGNLVIPFGLGHGTWLQKTNFGGLHDML